MSLDSLDHSLLSLLQTQIPFVARPFAPIAQQLGIDESALLARIAALKSPVDGKKGGGVIRQISAIFDSKSLGYQSTLIAAKIPPEKLDHAVAFINQHPGVSHNYERNHAFNLWYTLAVPPDSSLGLERTVQILHHLSQADSTRMMPTLKLYKIGVRFDLGDDVSPSPATQRTFNEASRTEIRPLSANEKVLIRILQQDLPIVPAPFDIWAQQAGISTESLLAAANDFLARGLMRRFSAVIRHREAGISANAMGVWIVPPEKQESFGEAAASFPAVSHCYLRRSYPDFPYSLFTMVHAPTRAQCEATLAELSEKTGIADYSALYSTREFKKVRVQYFLPDIPAWEASHGS